RFPDRNAHDELHAATVGLDRRQPPLALQGAKRPAHQLHADAAVSLERVAGGELTVQRTLPDAKGRDDLLLRARLQPGVGAPGQELRIALDIVDEREQLGGRLADERRALDLSHAALSHYVLPMAKDAQSPRLIAENRKARFDYFIEERYEAGLALQGWEVKALRAGRAQLTEAYVYLRAGEAFLIGAHVAPLRSTSTHVIADPVRTRKLLLNRSELQSLIGAVERRGYTLVPLELYWKAGRAKLAVGLAKGKKQHDKRAVEKDRDWQRDKGRKLRRG